MPELKYTFDRMVLDAETAGGVGDGEGDEPLSTASCADAPTNPLETRLVEIDDACAVIVLASSFELLPVTATV
jgi:hypothetical protein